MVSRSVVLAMITILVFATLTILGHAIRDDLNDLEEGPHRVSKKEGQREEDGPTSLLDEPEKEENKDKSLSADNEPEGGQRVWNGEKFESRAILSSVPDANAEEEDTDDGLSADSDHKTGCVTAAKYAEGTVTHADYPGKTYPSEKEAKAECSSMENCKGYWKSASGEFRLLEDKGAEGRTWKIGTPNDSVKSVKVKLGADGKALEEGGVPGKPKANWRLRMDETGSQTVAGILSFIVFAALIYSIWQIASPTSSTMFKLRCSNAWLSNLQLIAITFPLLYKDLRSSFPPKILANWLSMAFWNAFSNADFYGTFIMYAFHMWYGCVLACLCMCAYNFVFPGGVVCFWAPECKEPTTHLMGLESGETLSIVVAIVLVYLVCLSRLWIDTKRVFLLTVGGLWCNHLNPNGDWTDFSPFILGWDYLPDLQGAGVWMPTIIFLAFLIRGPLQYWLPMRSLSGGQISYFCSDHMQSGLNQLAQDYAHVFNLTLNWVTPLSVNQADSVHKVLTRIADKRAEVEALANDAWWEIIYDTTQLRHVQWSLSILEEMDKMNRFLAFTAERLFGGSHVDADDEGRIHQKVEHWLNHFTELYSSCIFLLIDFDTPLQDRQTKLTEGAELAEHFLEKIAMDIRHMVLNEGVSAEEGRQGLAFFHTSGMWISVVKGAATKWDDIKIARWSLCSDVCRYFTSTIFDIHQHIYAIVFSTAWTFAFLMSIYFNHYRATAVGTMSLMLIDKTDYLLDMLSRLKIRLIGVTLGVVFSNISAYLLCEDYLFFRNLPFDLISFYMVVLIQWAILMYGSLAGGENIYTFQTWAGFGSVELLRPLMHIGVPRQDGEDRKSIKAGSFQSVLLASFGMTILGCVLAVYGLIKGQLNKGAVPVAVKKVLECTRAVIENIRIGGQDIPELNSKLRDAVDDVDDAEEANTQWGRLISSTPSQGVLPVTKLQCLNVSKLAGSIHRLHRDDDPVDVKEVMAPLLPDAAYMDMLVKLAAKSFDTKEHESANAKQMANDAAINLERQLTAMSKSWLKHFKEASLPKDLKALATKWSFELSAEYIHLSLSKIQVYSWNHEEHWKKAEKYAQSHGKVADTVIEAAKREIREALLADPTAVRNAML